MGEPKFVQMVLVIWLIYSKNLLKIFSRTRRLMKGAQWLSGIVLDSRLRGGGLEPHRHHCVMSLSKTH